MDNLFKDYKGFNVSELQNYKVIQIKDSGNQYSSIYLINNVTKDRLILINKTGATFEFEAYYFTDNFGEYAPYPRMSIEIIK